MVTSLQIEPAGWLVGGMTRQREAPFDRPRIDGPVQDDVRLVGHDRLREGDIAESQPAVLYFDDELGLGLLDADRFEGLVEVDSTVGKSLDIQFTMGEGQRRASRSIKQDHPQAPLEDGPRGDQDAASLRAA